MDRVIIITDPVIAVFRVVIICVSFMKQMKHVPARLVHASGIGMWITGVGFEAF